MSSLNKTT